MTLEEYLYSILERPRTCMDCVYLDINSQRDYYCRRFHEKVNPYFICKSKGYKDGIERTEEGADETGRTEL